MLKQTPLYDNHVRRGAKIVPFAGWEMPVQYAGVIAEHVATRTHAGLFDVSHMGEILVEGREASAALNYLCCNDTSSLVDGKAQYSAILNDQGGVVDDIIIYRLAAAKFLVCVNASNADRDFEWFTSRNRHDARFTNQSSDFGQIALQGPRAMDIVSSLVGIDVHEALRPFHFLEAEICKSRCIVARTGYTGEDGVEIFAAWHKTEVLWDTLLERGESQGLVPCGLGARDTLRLEACLPLHGHELSEDISALESGLGWIVKLEKGDFVGREALVRQKQEGALRALIGFIVEEQGIARQGDTVVLPDGQVAGTVTSGTKTPTVQKALGLALVSAGQFGKEAFSEGAEIFVEVRGRRLRSRVAARPFYRRAR